MMRISRFAIHALPALLILLLGNMFWSASAHAFDIEEVRWGYAGVAHRNEINPLFLRLRNNTSEAEEFTLSLEKKSFGAGRVGARIWVAEEQSTLFLSPLTERWVTFYVYIGGRENEVQLLNERGPVKKPIQILFTNRNQMEEKEELDRVLFASGDEFALSQKAELKRFPPEIFPPVATATDILGTVFLDEMPRWQPEQRKSFMRWLQRGGVVHVLQSRTGDYPEFEEELAVLNGALDKQHIGGGIVLRHPFGRNRLDQATLKQIESNEERLFREEETRIENEMADYYYYDQDLSNSMFRTLRRFVVPDHNWPIMYVISFLYLFAVFPGAWIISKKRNDFRLTYGALLLAVFVFSMIFKIVGARGYGESTQINSIAVAHVLPDNELDVTQYSNAFVTNGGTYLLRHPGAGVIYSTASDDDVLGDILLGPQAFFSVDIPPFTSRPFIHRSLISYPAPAAELTELNAEEGLKSLKLNLGDVPRDAEVWALFRNRVSKLSLSGENWSTSRDGQSLGDFMRSIQDNHYGGFYDNSNDLDPEQINSQLLREAIQRSLRLRSMQNGPLTLPRNDRLYLFINTDMPDELKCVSDDFVQQSGKLVYQYELILPE